MKLRLMPQLALMLAAALFPRWGFAEQSDRPLIQKILRVTESYPCSLSVWNMKTRGGQQDEKLTELRIVLRANYLGGALPERKAEGKDAAPQGHFRLKALELKYYRDWAGPQHGNAPPEPATDIDWNKIRIRTEAKRQAELPLQQLSRDSLLRQVNLYSSVAMASNDLMRIGQFEFVPELAGVYELSFQVFRRRELTYDAREVIEFRCPDERPQLSVVRAGVLHQMRIPFMHIPLVASTFFEVGSERWNQNETDNIFRSVFLGLTAKRLGCSNLAAQLLLLEDPTSELGYPAQIELANRRAQSVLRLVQAKTEEFQTHAPCPMPTGTHNGAAHFAATACTTGIHIANAWPAQSQVFIKSTGSEISPQWFAEENRVVPLVASIEAQRIIFQPLRLKPLEDSDEVELRCEYGLPLQLLDCVQNAELEVKNAQGVIYKQKVSWQDLKAAAQGQRNLRLETAGMRAFLQPGEFTARMLLRTSWADSMLASAPVSFRVERRNIVRDEVFALSPYDRADLIYALDHERVAALSQEILQTVRDSLTAKTPEIFVLISGHSDSLGEHRAQGLGRDYNLSLSFTRAIYLRKLLVDSLLAHAQNLGWAAPLARERLYIPPALRASVNKNVNNAAILEVFKRPNCTNAETACAEDELAAQLEMLITEKVRHFRAGLRQENAALADIPSAAIVRGNIAALRSLLPLDAMTLEFNANGQQRYVHILSTGFGAAVPFYRRLEISEELQEVFCRMGFSSQELPQFFFGKDAHPSGRLMNRRVELNMVW